MLEPPTIHKAALTIRKEECGVPYINPGADREDQGPVQGMMAETTEASEASCIAWSLGLGELECFRRRR